MNMLLKANGFTERCFESWRGWRESLQVKIVIF
jgi:hypothetical protein